jgi:hypothetical protein
VRFRQGSKKELHCVVQLVDEKSGLLEDLVECSNRTNDVPQDEEQRDSSRATFDSRCVFIRKDQSDVQHAKAKHRTRTKRSAAENVVLPDFIR